MTFTPPFNDVHPTGLGTSSGVTDPDLDLKGGGGRLGGIRLGGLTPRRLERITTTTPQELNCAPPLLGTWPGDTLWLDCV